MLAQDSFDTAPTNVKMNLSSVPDDTTGIERIMLAAQGDLQRLMSAYFGRPIHVKCIYAHGTPRSRPASPEQPITQVHLRNNRVVCVATSVITITSPESERIFRRQIPHRTDFPPAPSSSPFYSPEHRDARSPGKARPAQNVETEGFHTEILKVFPDRGMFMRGENWLLESDV